MKKALFYVFLITLIAVNATVTYAQDAKVRKQLVTSGGMVGAVSGDLKMSGAFGQTAITKRTIMETEMVVGTVVHQGFWVPEGSITSIEEPNFSYNTLISNYPNPVNNVTTFKYELESNAFVTLRIFDMVGNQTIVFSDVFQSAGEQNFQWFARDDNGLDLPSGSYIYELLVQPAERTGATSSPYSLRNVMVVVK